MDSHRSLLQTIRLYGRRGALEDFPRGMVGGYLVEESPRWLNRHQHKELQPMGRGPGVRAASASSIQIDFKYKGRCRERISLAPTPANLKYAKRLKATIDHEIAIGTFDYEKHFPNSRRANVLRNASGIPIRGFLQSYIDSLTGQLEPETLDEYRLDAEIVARGLGESVTLETLRRAHVRNWISTLNLSKKRINNLLIPLRGALNQAVEDEKIEINPIADFQVKRTKEPGGSIDPFTPDEVEKLLGVAETGPLWRFWAYSGLRTGEIAALEWTDTDPECSYIHIWRAVRLGREKAPKTVAGDRKLDLLQPARDSLLQLAGNREGAIFRNPVSGEAYVSDKQIRVAFQKACQEAQVRYRYPYQLRHTFATWALSSGENPKWAATYMGHADVITFFKIYAKWMPKLAPDAGSKMIAATKTKAA